MFSKSCMAGLIVANLIVTATFGVAHAATAECPAKSTQMDDIIASLNQAPNCNGAMKVFEACAYGAGGDTQFGAVIEKKCEADFLSRLKGARKLVYQRELRVCDRKYRNKSGTMYISATAFCRAQVAQRYSQKALKGPKVR